MDVNLLTNEQLLEIYRKETGNNNAYIRPLYIRKYDSFNANITIELSNELIEQDGSLTIANLQICSSSEETNDTHIHRLTVQQPDYSGGTSTIEQSIYFISPQPFIHKSLFVFNGQFVSNTNTVLGVTSYVEMILSGFRLTPR